MQADFPIGLKPQKALHTITVFNFSDRPVCLSTIISNNLPQCSLPDVIHFSNQGDSLLSTTFKTEQLHPSRIFFGTISLFLDSMSSPYSRCVLMPLQKVSSV